VIGLYESAMKTLLMIAALAEGATGMVLLAYPPIVIGLLFGGEIAGAGVIMSRIAGITLIALGVACWPKADGQQAFYGMLTYSMLAMLYLIVLGIGGTGGILLWPGSAAHAGLSVLLVWLRRKKQGTAKAGHTA
jgi:hypothetical protein